jgi:asparaginyl-tRNA synthetase
MVEPEMAFAGLDDDMDLAEDFLVHVVGWVLERRRHELALLDRDVAPLERVRAPFPRITYTEAIDLLRRRGMDIAWGEDLGAEAETTLSQQFDRPVMVHRYPLAAKPFYMKPDPADPRLALCVDVLAPEGYGEIIGGGQREDDLAALETRLAEHALPREAFEWYLDLRRFGSVPHAGFGMGIERCVAWLAGLHHVRETIPFPRMLERLRP